MQKILQDERKDYIMLHYWRGKAPNYFPFKKPLSWSNCLSWWIHLLKKGSTVDINQQSWPNMAQAQKTSPTDPGSGQESPQERSRIWGRWRALGQWSSGIYNWQIYILPALTSLYLIFLSFTNAKPLSFKGEFTNRKCSFTFVVGMFALYHRCPTWAWEVFIGPGGGKPSYSIRSLHEKIS